MVEQPVEEGGGDDWVAEDISPFGEAAVGGEDHGALFVAGVDELEEQIAAARDDGQVADLVDHQQAGPAEEPQAFGQSSLAFGSAERGDEFSEGAEIDALAGLDGLDAEGGCEVALAGSGGGRGSG